MDPLVSIIIPTYNRAHLIKATLDSIVNQTYAHWECLVIDDGSTDDTYEFLRTHTQKDNRIKYYKRPNNRPKGANACRNYGFDLSKGTFINWFDSDDMMLPKKLEMQVKALSKTIEAPYCICQSSWFDKENNIDLGLRSKAITSENRFEDYVTNKIFWLTSAPLWRRNFILENNLKFDESLHQSQEYDFHIKALAISEAYVTINEPLVTIVQHNDSISYDLLSSNPKLVSYLKVKHMIYENFSHKLSSGGKLKLHESITLMLKELLILKNFKQAKNYMVTLIQLLKYLEMESYKKLIFSIKLLLVFASYRIFGVGYRLIQPLK